MSAKTYIEKWIAGFGTAISCALLLYATLGSTGASDWARVFCATIGSAGLIGFGETLLRLKFRHSIGSLLRAIFFLGLGALLVWDFFT